MCRGPAPASTSPEGETSTIRPASISSKPQPEAFIQTPRPSGSRTLGCPHTMSAWPAAASARQPSTASASARAESKGAYCAASSVMCHLYRYGLTRPQGHPRNAACLRGQLIDELLDPRLLGPPPAGTAPVQRKGTSGRRGSSSQLPGIAAT